MSSIAVRMMAGIAWSGAGRVISQLAAWFASIFVMRILDPSDYGLLAMAAILTGFIALFSELGLGWALVQARNVDRATLRSFFGLVLVVNAALYAIVFCAAPLLAASFSGPRLTDIVRVMRTQLLRCVPAVIPDALLQKQLEFKWRSVVAVISSIAAACSTLGLAIAGFGVWSLVYGALIGAACRSGGLNVVHPFVELPRFAFRGLGSLFAFGGYVAASRAFLYTSLQAD